GRNVTGVQTCALPISWFGLIPVLLALFVFTAAVSMIVSALYPRFRDVSIIWSVASLALFYATPVLYPLWVVSSSTLRNIVALNQIGRASCRERVDVAV